MTPRIRRQATLYLPAPQAVAVEAVRLRFNPAQAELIRAHVTLCREDEVGDWDALAALLRRLAAVEVSLSFGTPVREGNLVYLPATDGAGAFAALRGKLLDSPDQLARPHITLIHPRNGACSDADFSAIAAMIEPFSETFRSVTLIEQIDGGPWKDLATFG